ncbi:MAG: MgtC/SapB family protein [Candidatus Nomurabacteria bacterium]|nr:MgtC/SapB family protein [Candidatus Nomurabacteria bacterium]
MTQFFIQNSEIIMRLVVALLLGSIIGVERVIVHKEAGMKTHALVALGAAMFVLISDQMGIKYANFPGFNPTMMASQIIVGIGFIGAGVIIFREKDERLVGLTTASGLWVSAGIGMAAGLGFLDIAFIATILVIIVFVGMNFLENPIRKITGQDQNKG